MKCNVKTFTAPSAIPQSTTVYGTLTTSVPPCTSDDPPVDPPTGSCDVVAYQVFYYKLSCDTKQWKISAFEAGCMAQDQWGEIPSDCNVFYNLDVEQGTIDGYPLWARNAIATHNVSSGVSNSNKNGFLIKYVKGYLCTYGGIDENLQVPICYPTPLVQSGTMNTPLTDTSNTDSMAFSMIQVGDFGYPEHTPLGNTPYYQWGNLVNTKPDGTIDDYLLYIGWSSNQNLIYGGTNQVNFGEFNTTNHIGYNNLVDPPNEPKLGTITESCYLSHVWIVMYVEVGGVVKYSIENCSFETFPTDTRQQTEWVSYGNKPDAFNRTSTGCPIEDEVCYTWSSNQYCFPQLVDNITYSEPVQIYRKTKKVPVISIKNLTFLQLRKTFFGDVPRGTYSITTAVATWNGEAGEQSYASRYIKGVVYDIETQYYSYECGDNSSSMLFRKSRGFNVGLNAFINVTSANAPSVVSPLGGGTQLGFKKITSFETTNNLKKYHLRNIEFNKYILYNNIGNRTYEYRLYNANTGGFTKIADNGFFHASYLVPTIARRPIGRTARRSAPELGTRKDFTFTIDGHTFDTNLQPIKIYFTITINQL
jgi:hypothetical protein